MFVRRTTVGYVLIVLKEPGRYLRAEFEARKLKFFGLALVRFTASYISSFYESRLGVWAIKIT